MSNTKTIVGVVSLLFVSSFFSGCLTSGDFWDRTPCVAGERQVMAQRAPDDCGCAPTTTAPRRTWTAPQAQTRTPSTANPVTRSVPTYEPPQRTYTPTANEEIAILEQVNRIRAQHALRPLRFNPKLWVAARDHSAEQKRYGYMGHGSPDPNRRRLGQRIQQAGYQGRVFAEVVAWGYPNTASVVEGWMNSNDHRRILLDPELSEAGFSRVGEYWTGNLGAPSPYAAGTPSAPRAAAPARTYRAPTPKPTYRAPAPRRTYRAPTPAPTRTYRAPTPAPRRSTRVPAEPKPRPRPAPKKPAVTLPSTGFG